MQIEVAFVNRPNKNPKFGSIKGTDGIYYSVGADVLDRYRKGQVFDAPVASRDYQGKTYYSIPDSFDPNTVGAIIPQPIGRVAYNGPAEMPHANTVNRDVSITQQTLLKAFIGTGQFGLTDLPMLEEACTASAKRLVKAAS